MHNTICVFNPEHDMALASASKFYMAPALIKKMKSDLFMLPVWYTCLGDGNISLLYGDSSLIAGNIVTNTETRKNNILQFINKIKSRFSAFCCISLSNSSDNEYLDVSPWGWDSALLYNIESLGLSISSLPDYEKIETIRTLSSRVEAVKLLSLYRSMDDEDDSSLSNKFVPESFSLNNYDEVIQFIGKYKDVMLKAPWSGSGRGVRRVSAGLLVQDKGWVSRVIRTQGCVIGEPYYNKVIDFAMEFACHDGKVQFIGYSVFETDSNGAYKCNILNTDNNLEKILCQYVSLSYLNKVKQKLILSLSTIYAAKYDGVFGVDMMICLNQSLYDNDYWIHPCVEVNLRMNMGIVARRFYDRFVSQKSKGMYYVEHYFNDDEALAKDKELKEKYPLKIDNGKIVSGYMSLTPVLDDTLYQVYAIIGLK